MKNIASLFLLLILFGFGCAQTERLESDFDPQRGSATSPDGEESSQEGPFERTLKTAISSDGLSYVSNDLWISDQANVPDALMKENGDVYLYYTGWMVGDLLNTTAVAISQDNGNSWIFKYLELTGTPEGIYRVVDPDVILLPDGTVRMYFTSGNPPGIHYAESLDGITFEYKSSIFVPSNNIAIDSTTFKIGDTWHMYALSQGGVEKLWHLTSLDGIRFSVYGITSFPNASSFLVPANGMWIDDRFYLSLFGSDGSISSSWSKNGFDWYPSDESPLEPTGDELYVKDPTMVHLKNGQYLMIYVTNTP